MIKRKHLILLSLSGAIISFDQLTKAIVLGKIKLGDSRQLIANFLTITFAKNDGAVFGFFSGLDSQARDSILTLIPLLFVGLILFIFQRLESEKSFGIYALSALIGGAVGNFIDRARIGFVINFIDIHFGDTFSIPAFNLADLAICSGLALLLLNMILKSKRPV